MADPFIGGFATSAVNLVGNQMLQNNAFANNKAFWHETFNAQNRRQDFLNLYGASMQKQALRNAGLSTAAMDGAPFSETVGSGTMGNSVAPDFNFDPLGFAQTQATLAQIENVKANTNKIKEETKGQSYTNKILESDAAFRDAVNQSQLDMQYSTIQLNNWSTREKEDNLKVLQATAKNLNLQSESIVESINALKLQNNWIDKLNDVQYQKVLSEIGINKQQVQNLVLTGESIKLGNTQIGLQNDRLVFDLATDEDLQKFERGLGMFGNVLKGINLAVGTYKSLKK